jgi:hypothetical protein
MNRSSPNMRAIAERLIAYEAKGSIPSETNARAPFGGVVEKLRRPLAALTGSGGFRSLLSRALALANEEVRWLRGVHVKADGSLECPTDMTQLDREEITKGEVALIAQLLELLAIFIGESLTLRLVEDVWPEAPIAKLISSKEKK